MSHEFLKPYNNVSLKGSIKILENDMKVHSSINSFSRCVTKDESIEVTLRRCREYPEISIVIDSEPILNVQYVNYNGLRDLILCNRAMHHIITSRGVAV